MGSCSLSWMLHAQLLCLFAGKPAQGTKSLAWPAANTSIGQPKGLSCLSLLSASRRYKETATELAGLS